MVSILLILIFFSATTLAQGRKACSKKLYKNRIVVCRRIYLENFILQFQDSTQNKIHSKIQITVFIVCRNNEKNCTFALSVITDGNLELCADQKNPKIKKK